ncbi:hypothetical protein C8J57DRAFT_1719043 [Mycena rebaudengoi]|nr:hypothetical protein C8J57DRAFT_1719043 [Mycena rebaudengoi]
MPTAFDVIGVLSFVQGAITVIVAGVLAFRAATEQARENRRDIDELTQRLTRNARRNAPHIVLMFGVNPDAALSEEDNKHLDALFGENTQDLYYLQAIQNRPSLYDRWAHSAEDAKVIGEVSVRVSRMEAEFAEIRLVNKILDALSGWTGVYGDLIHQVSPSTPPNMSDSRPHAPVPHGGILARNLMPPSRRNGATPAAANRMTPSHAHRSLHVTAYLL